MAEDDRNFTRAFDFEIKIAQSKKEIEQTLKLRHEIFLQELAGPDTVQSENDQDVDIYDGVCDHLIVIDKIAHKVVGTYRLLLGSKVGVNPGFYADQFFDITAIRNLANSHEICELGRSCVHKDYRNRSVINLLWSGIAKYVKENNVRYLFGSPRFNSNDPYEVSRVFKFMKEKYYAPPEYRVHPKPDKAFKGLLTDVPLPSSREIFGNLPPLIKAYIRAGIVVCGPPAIDPLGSAVVCVLLDIEALPPSYKQHYL
ncbi:MAG: GNAT family N-acetyltransferase [Candidatus Omnitrophica bacterium]|nr:GNAT family N-acetyltransferase [Candidatus Omnitrophota bacterium]